MNVTDEMVEAALQHYYDTPDWAIRLFTHVADGCRRDMRAALEAALTLTPARAPVPEWFLQNMREKQRICSGAMRRLSGTLAGDRAQAQHQLLDELLQQATEVQP